MLRFAAFAVALLAVSPMSLAWAEPITINIQNNAGFAVSGVEAYPVSAEDGSIVDQNIGGIYENLASNEAADFTIASDACGPTYFRVSLANESQVDVTLDTCLEQTLAVAD